MKRPCKGGKAKSLVGEEQQQWREKDKGNSTGLSRIL
jgi:hypothetical protein